jgi:hypothetical protein
MLCLVVRYSICSSSRARRITDPRTGTAPAHVTIIDPISSDTSDEWHCHFPAPPATSEASIHRHNNLVIVVVPLEHNDSVVVSQLFPNKPVASNEMHGAGFCLPAIKIYAFRCG